MLDTELLRVLAISYHTILIHGPKSWISTHRSNKLREQSIPLEDNASHKQCQAWFKLSTCKHKGFASSYFLMIVPIILWSSLMIKTHNMAFESLMEISETKEAHSSSSAAGFSSSSLYLLLSMLPMIPKSGKKNDLGPLNVMELSIF